MHPVANNALPTVFAAQNNIPMDPKLNIGQNQGLSSQNNQQPVGQQDINIQQNQQQNKQFIQQSNQIVKNQQEVQQQIAQNEQPIQQQIINTNQQQKHGPSQPQPQQVQYEQQNPHQNVQQNRVSSESNQVPQQPQQQQPQQQPPANQLNYNINADVKIAMEAYDQEQRDLVKPVEKKLEKKSPGRDLLEERSKRSVEEAHMMQLGDQDLPNESSNCLNDPFCGDKFSRDPARDALRLLNTLKL